MRLGGVSMIFSRSMVLSSLDLRVHSGRFVAFLNPSNYNGAAALHLVTNFLRPSRNSVLFRNGGVGNIPTRGHRIGAVFRHCTLFPRLGIFRGITFNLHVGGLPRDRVGRGIRRVLELMGLSNLRGHRVSALSNNRRRHITVTHTVTGRPGILLLSRPLTTLSLGLHGSVRGRLGGVRRRLNVAFVFIARSRRRTLAVSSHIIIVSNNGVRRMNAPRSVCGRPRGTFITSFVNRSGVISNGVVGSFCIRFSNTGFRYLSGNFSRGRTISIIMEPRSISVIPINGKVLRNIIASISFLNIRCRVVISVNKFG